MAAGGELQLLGSWYSPYVIRAKVALGLKGLRYEYLEEDLFSKSDLLLKQETLEQAFMECSEGKAFFGGDAVGLADIALGSFLAWIQVVDEMSGTKLLDGARFPGLAAWAERFLAVDAVKDAMPEFERFLEHYKGFLAKLASPAAPAGYS